LNSVTPVPNIDSYLTSPYHADIAAIYGFTTTVGKQVDAVPGMPYLRMVSHLGDNHGERRKLANITCLLKHHLPDKELYTAYSMLVGLVGVDPDMKDLLGKATEYNPGPIERVDAATLLTLSRSIIVEAELDGRKTTGTRLKFFGDAIIMSQSN
jgi:hypothetical protein